MEELVEDHLTAGTRTKPRPDLDLAVAGPEVARLVVAQEELASHLINRNLDSHGQSEEEQTVTGNNRNPHSLKK